MLDSIRIVPKDDIALVEFDLAGEKINKFSTPVMQRLKDVVDELASSSYKAVVFISRKKDIFVAGADIDEIRKMKKKEEYMDALTQAHEIFNKLEDLPMPTLAAIDGACMGGGCEFIMCLDYRMATDSRKTKIGLPEVQLGIIPGFGGCVRMPRIMGLQASLDIILAGKSLDSKRAKKKGLVDEVVPQFDLEEDALRFARKMADGKKPIRKKKYQSKGFMDGFLESPVGRPIVFKKAREAVMKNSKGFYPAPLKALEVVKKTYNYSNRERALLVEAQAFCEVAVTDVSKHLISLYYMLEEVKKQKGTPGSSAEPRSTNSLGVLGAGVMGGGIAYAAADKGVYVRMKDIANDAISKGFEHAKMLWQKKVKRRRLNKYEFENRMARVSGTLDYSGFKGLDVVVEAIVEDMKIKQAVIGETAKHCAPDCVIATNTSSLSVTEMAQGHPNPENFVGMHFFNPVDKMPLVEVIKGEKTSDEAVATIFTLAKKMGKTPVVVKDGPGFLVNRLLLPLLAEAMFLLEEGAVIEEVDRFYTHQFGMPMGPFRLMDEVGLDVCVKVLKIFKESLGERIEVSDISNKLTETDRLGKKNGKGFYLYDKRGRETEVDQTVYQDLGLGKPKSGMTSKEAIERGMLLMVNEATRAIKEDRIVESAWECDLAMIMGTGFPPFRGGLLKYADSLGAEYIVQQLEEYAHRLGPRFKPADGLVAMANNKGTFH